VSPAAAPRLDEDLFLVDVERFQGPLDLLLHLIRQQDIDVLDIPIARITGQFLAAVEKIHALDLDRAGEFLEMAATLVRIKAQLLLPAPTVEGDEDPRAELVRRLLEYEQVQEISRRLRTTEAERARRFRKGYIPVRAVPVENDTPLETTWDEVLAAALAVREPERLEHRVGTRPVSIEEKLDLILTTLVKVKRVEFRRLVQPFTERLHGVMTFLASLELTRRRQVRLRQNEPFHELWLLRRDADDRPRETEEPAQPASEAVV
jgi:segregation and condensation protein A